MATSNITFERPAGSRTLAAAAQRERTGANARRASNAAEGTDCRRSSRPQQNDVTTFFHAKYWAHALTLRGATGSIEALSRSIACGEV